MNAFDTSRYVRQLFNGSFQRETFLRDAKQAGTSELLVDVRFFPERAMYWTRMFREAASQEQLKLSTLLFDSMLIADQDTIEREHTNISEWIRIAALSKIPQLMLRINGQCRVPDKLQCLREALEPMVQLAHQYGMRLILSNGNAGLSGQDLLNTAKALGFEHVRIDAQELDCSEARCWLA